MRCAFLLVLAALGTLTAPAQTELLTVHTAGGPDLVLRDVRIGAIYNEINGFTARAEAMLPPGDNPLWTHLSLRLQLLLADGRRRELAMECSGSCRRLGRSP
jgi:hypothetical protein